MLQQLYRSIELIEKASIEFVIMITSQFGHIGRVQGLL